MANSKFLDKLSKGTFGNNTILDIDDNEDIQATNNEIKNIKNQDLLNDLNGELNNKNTDSDNSYKNDDHNINGNDCQDEENHNLFEDIDLSEEDDINFEINDIPDISENTKTEMVKDDEIDNVLNVDVDNGNDNYNDNNENGNNNDDCHDENNVMNDENSVISNNEIQCNDTEYVKNDNVEEKKEHKRGRGRPPVSHKIEVVIDNDTGSFNFDSNVSDFENEDIADVILNYVCKKTIANLITTYKSEIYTDAFTKDLFTKYCNDNINSTNPLFKALINEVIEKKTKDPYLEEFTNYVLKNIIKEQI